MWKKTAYSSAMTTEPAVPEMAHQQLGTPAHTVQQAALGEDVLQQRRCR
jgi:hypothetical protein